MANRSRSQRTLQNHYGHENYTPRSQVTFKFKSKQDQSAGFKNKTKQVATPCVNRLINLLKIGNA